MIKIFLEFRILLGLAKSLQFPFEVKTLSAYEGSVSGEACFPNFSPCGQEFTLLELITILIGQLIE
jgi:hypothetical protein